MDKNTRNAIERATQRARRLLEEDFSAQLEGSFDVHRSGAVAAKAGSHLSPRQSFQRERIVAAIEHKRAAGLAAPEAAADYLRDAAFTTLNRFVALKMLEARDLVQECITKGEQSSGYREFCGLAPGLPLVPGDAGYRLYIESLFDELSTEVKVLFDRRDPSSVLWPKRAIFEQLLEILNASELAGVWGEDETIGWVYQYFNGADERRKMREESQAPRSSRELAVRNQFFTPRYVVQFLTDNTLGRIWYEMRGSQTVLAERCEYMVRKPGEAFAPRPKKDPRDIRVLDPACGSGHFLLYTFDLLVTIYEEAYADTENPKSEASGKTLAEDYPSLDVLRKAMPGLILAHNLHGVDIDPRCVQIAQLALWMRAQRFYRDLGIGRAERPQIRRSSIVIAEPLVANDQLVAEFVARLDDAQLGRVFTGLVEALKLAGDLGLLLRIEALVSPPTSGSQTGDLFAPPEERIRATLESFLADEGGRTSSQRRLFVEDAAHGLGLLETAESRFDVVVMNPPFGAMPERAATSLAPADCGNLYSAFVRRAVELSADAVGCITDRTFLTQSSFSPFRRELLAGSVSLHALCDLGWGVLDANVQTAAYVLLRGSTKVACVDARDSDDRAVAINRSGGWKWIEASAFMRLPDNLIAYALPEAVLKRVAEWAPLGDLCSLPRGLGSNKAERTYMAWVEVPQTLPAPPRWEPLANGGEFSPWWREDRGVADWRMPKGETWVSMRSSDSGRPYDQSGSSDYFQPGISFPKQAASFNVAALPAGFIPTREGKVILPRSFEDVWHLVAYLNSGVVRAFVRDTCGLHKQSGAIGRVPVPEFSDVEQERLGQIAKALATIVRSSYQWDETSRAFCGPAPLLESRTIPLDPAIWRPMLKELDVLVARKFGLRPEDSWLESAAEPALFSPSDRDVVSWAVGVVLGRFQEKLTGRQRPSPDLLAEVPPCSPAMVERGRMPEAIAVTDPGHPYDLGTRVREILARRATGGGLGLPEQGHVLDDGVGQFFRSEFFAEHLERYRVARRKAPIYWQLATPSASYSVWLYIHAFTKDTLFRVQNEFVAPKLAHEERRLESMAREQREKAAAAGRRALASQEAFVEELRAFLDEVKRIAPLWKPNLDDGVIINFAPLWRLVPQHKAWQRELKATWDALCGDKYNWAHLSMHLWPERVVPKCATDRSLAIAHGLEDVFWVEGSDGKWTARKNPTRPMDELVRERTSPAVKAALKSLLEAPVAAGNGGRPSRGGRRRAAASADERGGW